jgi:hypothetical protein
MPGTIDRSGRDAHQPWLRPLAGGPGTDPLEAVNSGLDLAQRGVQGTPERLFQAVLGCGHALTQPAAS